MPKIVRTDPFKIDFSQLTERERKQGGKAIRLLAENPKHPSLEVHRIKGTKNLWEAYINKDIRLI